MEITNAYIEELQQAVSQADVNFIKNSFVDLHAVDIALILDSVELEEAKYLFLLLDTKQAADVLVELEEDVRKNFLQSFSAHEIAQLFIDNVESDDAVDILGELSDEISQQVIDLIHKEDVEQASDIVDLLNYEEDTAGGLMGKELVAVNISWTSQKCIEYCREMAAEVENFYTVYVVDNNKVLQGKISLKKLILVQVDTKVEEILEPVVMSVKADTDEEEVAKIMQKYDLVSLPVVDELGRLLGRITIDDIVDVIKEEAEKDYQLISGITGDVEFSDNVWTITRARLPWLFIGMIGGVIGSQVIGRYEGAIKIYPEMAFFIPLITAMGGNVGVQSSSIVVQSIASHSLNKGSIIQKLWKELSVGIVNAIICTLALVSITTLLGEDIALSATVGTSLFSVIIFASVFGSFVPLILDKYKVDPALATGPFITTTNDILGLILYFTIGRLMYGIF